MLIHGNSDKQNMAEVSNIIVKILVETCSKIGCVKPSTIA